jgi:porin
MSGRLLACMGFLLVPGWSVLQAQSPPDSAPAAGIPASGPAPSATQPAIPDKPSEPFLGILHNERLTGDWGGFRKDLEARGITLNVALNTIYQQNAHGGLDTHNAHRITGTADYELTLDTGAAGLWKSGQLYVLAESGWNDAIDDRVGDLFGVNADAMGDRSIRVRELWYEQKFFGDKLRFKFGKMDMAVDIDTNAYANWEVTQFINGALVNTGNLPLPDYGLGATIGVVPTEWMYVTLSAADAQADGNETGFRTAFHGEDYFFSALEVGFTPAWKTAWGKLPGNYRLITWYDPQPKQTFEPPPDEEEDEEEVVRYERDDVGFAFNMDQLLIKEEARDDADTQGLGFFLRYGYAHEEVNAIEHFWSLGAQYEGLLPGRDKDVLAFGFAQGILSDRLRWAQGGGGRESVYELYYSLKLFPWLTLTPDFQYITDPAADAANRDAFVAALRIVMAF